MRSYWNQIFGSKAIKSSSSYPPSSSRNQQATRYAQTMKYPHELFHRRTDMDQVALGLKKAADLVNDCIAFDQAINLGDIDWTSIHRKLLSYSNEAAAIHIQRTNKGITPPIFQTSKQVTSPAATPGSVISIMHALDLGSALCGTIKGTPSQWPAGHFRAVPGTGDKVTCTACIAASLKKADK